MKKEFKNKGLKNVQIALLTHKMRIEFNQEGFTKNHLTPDLIKDEIEMVGFGA